MTVLRHFQAKTGPKPCETSEDQGAVHKSLAQTPDFGRAHGLHKMAKRARVELQVTRQSCVQNSLVMCLLLWLLWLMLALDLWGWVVLIS